MAHIGLKLEKNVQFRECRLPQKQKFTINVFGIFFNGAVQKLPMEWRNNFFSKNDADFSLFIKGTHFLLHYFKKHYLPLHNFLVFEYLLFAVTVHLDNKSNSYKGAICIL